MADSFWFELDRFGLAHQLPLASFWQCAAGLEPNYDSRTSYTYTDSWSAPKTKIERFIEAIPKSGFSIL